jgi:parvulin-like peptidyl-prolyl isomerase
LKRKIAKSGVDSQKVLSGLGYDDKKVREELLLPLAWQAYLARVLTPEGIREFFEMHREEFDGTELRASQIFLKLNEQANETERKQVLDKLSRVRSEIRSGKISFADAARQHSESPSRETGGDVGFFGFRGKMPLAFTKVAFQLKVGDVSEPFVTQFGAHLVTVTERKPGTLSLEDVRPQVLTQISGKMWNETVAQERGKAKIEWVGEKKDE